MAPRFKKIQMTIRVSPVVKEKAENAAFSTHRSVSNLVELFLEKGLEELLAKEAKSQPKTSHK